MAWIGYTTIKTPHIPSLRLHKSVFRLPAKRNDIGEIQDDHDIVIETHGFYEGLAE